MTPRRRRFALVAGCALPALGALLIVAAGALFHLGWALAGR